eukprot:c33509_g1_i1 orf=2-820(-)
MQACRDRLWKDFLKDPSLCSNTQKIKHESTQEWLWMDRWNNPSRVEHLLLRLTETKELATINTMQKAQEAKVHQPLQVDHSNSGHDHLSTWKILNIESAPPSLEQCVVRPQLYIDNLAHILHTCKTRKDRAYALRLHAYMREIGLDTHRLLGNRLVSMLAEVGSMHNAHQVFDKLVDRSEWSFNSLITGYIRCGKPQSALALYEKTLQGDYVHVNGHTFIALLKACAKKKDLETGLKLHANVAAKGLLKTDPFVGNTLVDMYAKCSALAKAQQ